MSDLVAEGYITSPMQRHVWAWTRGVADSPHVHLTVRFPMDISVEALSRAIGTVTDRHEALRTSFVVQAGRAAPLQVIGVVDDVELDHAGTSAESDLPSELHRLRTKDFGRLEADGCLIRWSSIARRSASGEVDATYLMITAHRLVADAASLRIVVAEIDSLLRGIGDVQAGSVLQYADFAQWHSDLLTSSDSALDRAFWDEHIDGEALAVPGPGWGSGPAGAPRTALPAFNVPQDGVDSVASLVELEPEVLCEAVFRVVVHKLSSGQNPAVAIALRARSHSTIATSVGAFAREVPVRVGMGTGVRFDEFAKSVRRAGIAAADHADHLDPEILYGLRGQNKVPVVSFEFVRQTGSDEPIVVHSSSSSLSAIRCRVCFDGVNYSFVLDFSDTVDPVMVRSIAIGVEQVLSALAEDSTATVGALDILPSAELTRVMDEGVGPTAELPVGSVADVIAQWAIRTPGAPAVSSGETTLTFEQLHERGASLAARLTDLGVVPGDRVVVSLGRSTELMVAMLAVWQAGAAYVPVDVDHPVHRLEFILGETSSPVALVDSSVARLLSGTTTARLLVVGDAGRSVDSEILLRADPRSAPPVTADSEAYVMYTSGTTGAPQGVQVTHGNILNYLTWAAGAYELARGGVALVHTSISFDLTVTTLFAPLTVGGEVRLLDENAGVTGLIRCLRDESEISLVKLTPTHLDIIAELLDSDDVRGRVRTLVIGGEALRAESVQLFRDAGTRIFNEYGPTEATVGCVAYEVTAHDPTSGPVPIGRPIANTSVYVLDSERRPVPDLVAGELWVGGAGVSTGYLGRPESTADKFVKDPVTGFSTGRVYRTGDLVRRRPDGVLDYLGRIDQQIKVRGVRIEPGEIESVLLTFPGVAQAAVVARVDEDPGRSSPLRAKPELVAYVTSAPGAAPTPEQLQDHCRSTLPGLLVPSSFVVLDVLPVTVNGKLDRAALPRPRAGSGRDTLSEKVSPRTATEVILADAVETVLGLSDVGIDDNYFVLGGDSIRSVMVASRAQARGVDVSVADLHRHPTIRDCADYLDTREDTEPVERISEPFDMVSDADRALMPDDVEDAFPLSLLQEGMIFHRDFAAKSAVYHALASVRLRARWDRDVMRMVIRQLIERHPMLRTSFDMVTFGQPLQLVHDAFETPLHVRDLRSLPAPERNIEIDEWVSYEKDRGFELDEYPLIRFMVHLLDDNSFQFTYGFHHEIVDGWSEALMVTELFSHYFSVLYDEPLGIKVPSATMRDAVALERAALQDPRNAAFWVEYLADATLMRLPRESGSALADKGDRDITRIVVPVDQELSDAIKAVAGSHAVPLKTVLMAAHMAVMSIYGGLEDTLTYTVTNGRPETADGSTAIGLFVNSLAVRMSMHGGTWTELFHRALESERATMPYRRLPMAELKRHQGSEPLAETLFFFTDYHVYGVLDQWEDHGVDHVATELYGESTFPFCGIFRLDRQTRMLEVRVEYDALQFSAELMDSIRDSYVRALRSIAAGPEVRFETADLLPDSDRVTVAAVSEGAMLPAELDSVPVQITRVAARTPDAVAVCRERESLTYGELMRRSRALAQQLVALGAGPDRVVGVLAERSIAQVIALVGVWMAGAAYTPLSPSSPTRRLSTIAHAAEIVAVVHTEAQAHLVPHGYPGVEVTTGPVPEPTETRSPALPTPHPSNMAYVLFTSGSTGEPKGVAVEHRHLASSLHARKSYYDARPERFLMLSSFAFDSSVAGLFWTLAEGGTLVLPDEGAQVDPAELVRTIAIQRPTHTLGIPSLLAPVLDLATSEEAACLHTVIAAGEACPSDLVRNVARQHRKIQVHNEYGPTEATVWATVWRGEQWDRPQVPIGSPIAGTTVTPRDHHGRLVPLGVAAELFIGGLGVARGYVGRPSATAAVFRPDPSARAVGRRCYATGDLGRHLRSGEIEFHGRRDQQVKIAGFRVEPGEVEVVLSDHPAVERAVVIAVSDERRGRALVAYVRPATVGGDAGARVEVDSAQLQAHVRSRLPRYMVPAAVVVLDEVPLTSAGKVDRNALPAPVFGMTGEEVAPSTDTERALVAIWSNVLGVDGIGVGRSFFDLGGESLRAMQATTAMNKMFSTRMSVRALFDAPTVAELARELDMVRATGSR